MITRRSATLALVGCFAVPAGLRAGTATAPAPAALPVPSAIDPVPPKPELPPAPPPLTSLEQTLEVLRLQAAMKEEVPRLVARSPASDAAWIELAKAEVAGGATLLGRPQLLVVVDRNPRVQQLVVMLAAPQDEWRVVGGAKVSTGSTGRFDHYITPRGSFHITPAILGFRAEGTLNENGIRGLGSKGMRVWDFGWHTASKGWDAGPGKPDRIPIRLMMHATDPDKLEQRIGRPASQGCVRVPSPLNRFLDRHGVLDFEYERAAVNELRFRALLLPDRQPSALAGNTLVVVDSADKTGIAVASRTVP